jgi:hypothetical protein
LPPRAVGISRLFSSRAMETTKTSVLAEYLGRIDGGIPRLSPRCRGMTVATIQLY